MIVAVITILLVAANYIKVDFYITAPGVALPLSEIISVEKGEKDAAGAFYLTAVSSKQANLFNLLLISIVRPKGFSLSPKEETIPQDMDMETYLKLMEEMMSESQIYAKVVALRQMGYETQFSGEGAEISEVMESSHARDVLKPGDVIIEINDQKVDLASEAVKLIQNHQIGDVVDVKVKRDDQVLDFKIKTIESGENPEKASIGIYIFTHHREVVFPVDVEIHTENILGPSAGTMFTLEIINQLHPEDLTRGYKIAGTGTIDFDGLVGPISGVTQKVLAAEREGAEYFLSPPDNYQEAVKAAAKLQVIQVKTIEEAVNFLLGLQKKAA